MLRHDLFLKNSISYALIDKLSFLKKNVFSFQCDQIFKETKRNTFSVSIFHSILANVCKLIIV